MCEIIFLIICTFTNYSPNKRRPKSPIEDGVNDRVQNRTEVAEPQAQDSDVLGNRIVTLRYQGLQDLEQEERRPAEDEGEENEAQYLRLKLKCDIGERRPT